MSDSKYIEQIRNAREERDAAVRSNPRHWLTLAGLFPLHEGKNGVASIEGAEIQLPPSDKPLSAEFLLENNSVYIKLITDPGLLMNGGPLQDRPLRLDVDGEPDLLEWGQYSLMGIRRGDRVFLRLWDRNTPAYLQFQGFHYFPINPEYRIKADFEKFDPPKISKALNAIGVESETRIMGIARFSVNGMECSMLAEESGEELLFNFTDATRTDSTYPGGRLLEVEQPAGSMLILDFNLARNWPCAYTPYATCPLPPRENYLAVRIEAGEMRYH